MARFGQERRGAKAHDAALHDATQAEVTHDMIVAARHRTALVLSEIAAEGTPGLSRALRRAAAGDKEAAAIPVSALVHAAPGMTALDCHQLLRRAHVRESDLAGDISPGQRVALLELVERTDRLRRTVAPRTGSHRAGLG
jgi:hypothetical protein